MAFTALLSFLLALLYVQTVVGVRIISKTEWGGRPAINQTALPNGLPYAIIHHTAGSFCSTKESCVKELHNIQDYHMDTMGWDDIGYNFLIGGDGSVYEGRGWNVQGAHAIGWNSKSIGISFMGNYNNIEPTSAQLTAAKSLLTEAVTRGQLKTGYILYGHRQVGNTECPGINLFNEIQTWSAWKA